MPRLILYMADKQAVSARSGAYVPDQGEDGLTAVPLPLISRNVTLLVGPVSAFIINFIPSVFT